MTLSEDDKDSLRSQYESWGVEAVRRDLRRPLRRAFVSKDINDFAREWVAENDAREVRRDVRNDRLIKVLMVAAAIEFGVAIGLNIPL